MHYCEVNSGEHQANQITFTASVKRSVSSNNEEAYKLLKQIALQNEVTGKRMTILRQLI